MKWGMDIVGKLPTAPGQRMYMLAVTDYFTKWVEAEAYHQVRDREVKKFIWKNVICCFGVPSSAALMKSPAAGMNVKSVPATMPGADSGS